MMVSKWKQLKKFWLDEDGSPTAESVIWLIIAGLGAVAIAFGIVGALRGLAGKSIHDIRSNDPYI